MPPTEERLAALTPLPELEIVGRDIPVDLPENEKSVARAPSPQSSTQLKDASQTPRIDRVSDEVTSRVAPTSPVTIVTETTEIRPTPPGSPELKATESGPKVIVGALREITSEDPNFQRQWSY